MSIETNERVLQSYVEAKNRQDVEAALELCHEDYRYESVGLGAPVEGKPAARQFYRALFASLPDYRGEFDGLAWQGDTAVAWGRFGGTLAADFVGIPVAAGGRLEVPVSFVCTFRDGLLLTDTGYFDVATLCEQAGIPLGRLRPSAGDEFARRFAEFWANPQLEALPELVDPDVVASWPGVHGTVSGFDAYRDQIAGVLSLAPDLRLEVLDHLAEGDRVLIEWRGRGTVAGEGFELEGVDRFRLRDGRTVDSRIVYDSGTLREAVERASARSAA